jgi:hypothetical protein
MAGNSEWYEAFTEALNQRADWLTSKEIPRLKEQLRIFYNAYSTLYNLLLSQGVITEDPYKNESKVSDIQSPETGPFTEANRLTQFSLRLANYDNELDYVVNFYTFSLETLGQDKIKILLSVLKFIDWLHPTPESSSHNTQAMAAIITDERRNPSDPVTARTFTESLKKLEAATKEITGLLKEFSDYNREAYKGEIRDALSSGMTAQEATSANLKKLIPQALPGLAFYAELVEELIKEDFSSDAPVLQKKMLQKLAVAGIEKKDESEKKPDSFKPLLIEALNAIGGAGATLGELIEKLDANHEIYQNKKKSFGEKIKELLAKMMNKEPDEVIYTCESIDPNKGGPMKEKIEYNQFRDNLEKKSKILLAIAPKGSASAKLEAMQEAQLIELLDRNLRDLQTYHRQLGALDDFFKAEVDADDRAKVKGIKPELSTIKNAMAKAGNKKHDFLAVQEEAAQFQKLGVKAT